ncbi:MAG: hypothetical protein NC830_05180, partial [Candidatus Omnitrophica bacterium]|nr:hypothetical protein [Candidatus Omnitrophota bacterium]
MRKPPIIMVFVLIFGAGILFSEAELKFYLAFDEGSGTIVKDSIKGLEGQVKGEVKWVEGRTGKGVYFGGKEKEADCIVFPQAAKDEFLQRFSDGPFTISVWIKPDSKKDYHKFAEILNASGDVGPGWRLTYFWNMILFRSGLGPDYKGKVEKYFWEIKNNPSSDRVVLDKWNHICIKRDRNKKLFMYLNGKKVAESETEFEITGGKRPLTVGAYVGGYGYGFMGAIDELKIYKGELTDEEIFNEYKQKNGEEKKIKLDGKLEEEIWEKGRIFTNFVSIGTTTLAPVQSKVIFNYDEENLYFAFICDEPGISKIKKEIKENSLKVYLDDSVEIMLDSDSNKADYYHFLFNPSAYYGVEFRTQGGFVGSVIKDFKLYAGSSIEKDRWVIEVAIPISSLAHERIKEQISLNFARNRRIDMESKEESSIAEKGQFHNPSVFKIVRLENVDLALYAVEFKDMKILDTEKEGERIKAKLSGTLKKSDKKPRTVDLEIYEGKLGVLGKSRVEVSPGKEREVVLSINVPEAKEYNLWIDLEDNKKKVYSGIHPVKINYVPISLELLKPFYRNSIYSTQKIDEIVVNVKVGLRDDQITNSTTQVSLTDMQNRLIAMKTDSTKKESRFNLKIPEPKDGEYTISGKILKEGKTLYETNVPLYKLPPAKGNEVYVDEKLNLVLNGKAIIPMIWWAGS